MDCVVKELQERCVDRGGELPFDKNKRCQKFRLCVVACRAAVLKTKTSFFKNKSKMKTLNKQLVGFM